MENLHPIFQGIIKQHAPALADDVENYNVPFTYKGYVIDLDEEAEEHGYLFYPATHSGPSHDYDYIGEEYRYCGNCKFHLSIQECIDAIDIL